MAEVTYKSAGIYASELDLSQPVTQGPTGVPAGIIGTANEGPAFVPVTVGSYSDFARIFGATDGEKFGPLAVYEFLKNAQSLTYLRVLGVGDGKRRSTSTGKVSYAGYVVGEEQVQDNGTLKRNPYGTSARSDLGRVHFLGCFMSESAGSTIFSEAGIQKPGAGSGDGGPGDPGDIGVGIAHPIIRGVLMAPSGVFLTLSGGLSSGFTNLAPTSGDNQMISNQERGWLNVQGQMTGTVELATQNFVMLLNGHKDADGAPNVITASFDLKSNGYFGNVFNRDPLKIEEKGHLLYARYDVHPAFATVTGTNVLQRRSANGYHGVSATHENVAFLLTGSSNRNETSGSSPNYESFQERFTNSKTPYFISQDFGGSKYNLFRVHAIGDGEYTNTRVKVSIQNIKPSNTTTSKFGTFDLFVRDYGDTDREPVILERYSGVSLDRSSDRYIGRVIGDRYTYFDFDQASTAQKLVETGDHLIRSAYVRVELSDALSNGEVPADALPIGFRGPDHLVTSGSGPLMFDTANAVTGDWLYPDAAGKRAVEPPVRYRRNVAIGSKQDRADSTLYWGVRFDRIVSLTQDNLLTPVAVDVADRSKFFPSLDPSNFNFVAGNNAGKADSGGTILDSDRFNNNIFTLERIKVRTGSNTYADAAEWASASYVRQGSISASPDAKTRAFSINDLKTTPGNRTFAKFTVFMQGGFDGTNVFNKDKTRLTNAAAKREMDDSSQGELSGPTVAAYRKALDLMGNKTDVDIKLLAIPGLRHTSVTDYAIDAVENRFDAMYVMDIQERDGINQIITSSIQTPNVTNTVEDFQGRALNTSFAAAYFPDVIVGDPTTNTNVRVPPSVAVMGAMSLNDSVAHPWFAPAGFTRGALDNVIMTALPLNKDNMDNIYEADINPLTSFAGTGVVVWGQKTLLANASALDRINVRRLLINIRRKIRNISNLMLFEPNRQETLDKFNSLVKPVLQSIQDKSGVDRYKVLIDSSTTTQADIENNTLRGKIFIQPTRTAEFIALDFVVTNQGNFDNV
tara:strand:- start:15154 stop:18225 length:3072 start_codon:yes stop_codon:yes gene_type:complete